MKKYLIGIKSERSREYTTINGDSCRPFMIAHNLWNYTTPGHAAQRLEKLARAWENNGSTVERIYGTVADMPTCGSPFNVDVILIDYNASDKTYLQLLQEHHYY